MTLRVSFFEQVVGLMRSWGFTFYEVAGCRGRDNGGTFNPTHFVEHHDASSKLSGVNGALAAVISGRPGIEGMLSQFFCNRKGEGYWVGSGQAWHAGVGGPLRGIAANAANQAAVGLEVANNGIDEPYDPAVDRFIEALEAACMIVAKRTEENVFGHKEWTDRKSDPRKDMAARRVAVATIIRNGAPKGATLSEEDELGAFRDEVIGRIDTYNFQVQTKLDRPPLARIFRSDPEQGKGTPDVGNGSMSIGAIGFWWDAPHPAYIDLLVATGFVSSNVENRTHNVYLFMKQLCSVSMPPAFDPKAFADQVAASLPKSAANAETEKILSEIKKYNDEVQEFKDRLAAASQAEANVLAGK